MLSRLSLSKKNLLLYGLGGYIAVKSLKFLIAKIKSIRLLRKGSQKLKQRNSVIPSVEVVPLETQQLILSLTASELAQAIQAKQITSMQAVSTYISRAYTIGRELSLTAEECFQSALEQAKKCDEETYLGINRGSLQGVPISIKDHMSMNGFTSSSGMIYWLDYPDTETALLVELLTDQGAIPFVRSNVCQVMMWIESSNNIYGQAKNPWDPSRTVGGSSGGEGGLIASRCSPLGIGSDIGGSIRTPCHFCGVYGLRITPKRISKKGVKSSYGEFAPLDTFIPVSLGPIGRCVDDLVAVSQAWLCAKMSERDPQVVPLPFNNSLLNSKEKLKIGYFVDYGFFDASLCIRSAIEHCVKALDETHELVPFEIPSNKALTKCFVGLSNSSGTQSLEEGLHGEPAEPYYQLQIQSSHHPWVTKLLLHLLNKLGYKRVSEFLNSNTQMSADDYIELHRVSQDLTDIVVCEWEKIGLDAIICPVFGVVAPHHNTSVDVITSIGFCCMFNTLQFPTGVVPAGLVLDSQACYEDKYNDLSTFAAKSCMQTAQGLPYALQVVALPYKDEIALRVMKLLENVFKFHKFPI